MTIDVEGGFRDEICLIFFLHLAGITRCVDKGDEHEALILEANTA